MERSNWLSWLSHITPIKGVSGKHRKTFRICSGLVFFLTCKQKKTDNNNAPCRKIGSCPLKTTSVFPSKSSMGPNSFAEYEIFYVFGIADKLVFLCSPAKGFQRQRVIELSGTGIWHIRYTSVIHAHITI